MIVFDANGVGNLVMRPQDARPTAAVEKTLGLVRGVLSLGL
jgi:hypothetical protein